eukprot:10102841-Lingulodinium_polyedra.AAC.1
MMRSDRRSPAHFMRTAVSAVRMERERASCGGRRSVVSAWVVLGCCFARCLGAASELLGNCLDAAW